MSTKKLGFGLMRLPLLNENDEASVRSEEHTSELQSR